jgi:malonyl-CoA O-methyltransferase
MSRDDPGFALDRRAVARAFGRASTQYDAAATLQSTVRAELLERLGHFALAPAVVLDAGAGTAPATVQLARRFPQAVVVAFDLAHGMLVQAGERLGLRERLLGGRFGHPFGRVRGDVHRLPFASGSAQLVFSNLMLQWSDDLDAALREIRRVLAPGGMFTFSSFGPDTLRELRESWAAVDGEAHVNPFVDMHDLGSALARAGFAEPVLDVDRHRLEYADPLALMRELQQIGARNALADRPRGLTGRRRLAAVQDAYRAAHATPGGGVTATWEVIYATCFRSDAPDRPTDPHAAEGGPREVTIDVARIGRRGPAPDRGDSPTRQGDRVTDPGDPG